MSRFDDKVMLVTGAATGIGHAITEYLCGNDILVYGIGLDSDEGCLLYAGRGSSCIFWETDLCDTIAIQPAVDDLLKSFDRLDAVVNCVGVYPKARYLKELSDGE